MALLYESGDRSKKKTYSTGIGIKASYYGVFSFL
jgi:hypothetical protein